MDQRQVGERIRQLRERKAWTQEHLAGAAAISARTVQRAEEGAMSAETLTAIAGALGAPVEALTRPPEPAITPVVIYDDTNVAIEFLEKAFGFAKRAAYPGPDGKIMHAELTMGDGVIMLGPSAPALRCTSPRTNGRVSTGSTYTFVEDVDAHFRRARDAGAEILVEPADVHGDRRYIAQDPEGHVWIFAQHL